VDVERIEQYEVYKQDEFTHTGEPGGHLDGRRATHRRQTLGQFRRARRDELECDDVRLGREKLSA